jgi:uncharacterized protein
MERRSFIRTAAAAAVAASGAAPGAQAQSQAPATATGPVPGQTVQERGGMKYRMLGRTGEVVSMVGMGGFHLAKNKQTTPAEATRLVHAAIGAGISFFDNCWDYNGGESEVRLGNALAGGYRQRIFLMTKMDGRSSAGWTRQFEESLRRLRTDHVDLVQFHEIIRMEDPDRVFAPGGALEAALQARQAGKLRFIGFTGHKSPAIHRRMFEVADAHGFHFDTVQMPLNVMDAHYDSFEQAVLPIANQRGTGVLGMKTFGDTFIVDSKVMPPIDMLHYSMSLPTSLQVCGIDNQAVLDQTLEAVRTFQPLDAVQRAAILARSAAAAADGRTERYKTTDHFDGTVHNPQWLA